MPSDVQDALITILSEKTLPIPELATEVQARTGSTSSPPPTTATRVSTSCPAHCAAGSTRSCCRCRTPPRTRWRSSPAGSPQLGAALELPATPRELAEIRRVVTVFRELRSGRTEDGRTAVKSPSGTLSTAEAISVVTGGLALAAHFGDGVLRPHDVAAGILGAVVKDPSADRRCGRSTWRPLCANATAGPTSTGRAGRSPDDRPTCSGSGTTGPGRRGRWRRRWRRLEPDIVLIEGPPEADKLVELAATRTMAAAGRVAGVCDGRRHAGRVLAVRGVQPGVAGDHVRAPAASRSGSAICRPRTSSLVGPARSAAADGPARDAGRGRRVRRPGALVGRRDRVAAARRRAVHGDRRRDARAAARAKRRPGVRPQREAYMRTVLRKARRRLRDGSRWSAVPGTCRRWQHPLPPATHDQRS